MSETLEHLHWPSIPGYTDLNQFGPTYKVTVLDHKGKLPGEGVELVATGIDVYNGSFSKYQVEWCVLLLYIAIGLFLQPIMLASSNLVTACIV